MDLGFLSNDRPKTIAAARLAIEYHGDQERKWTGEPYYNHPIEVTKLLIEHHWVDDDTSAAAMLHDTLEDTDISGGLIQMRCGHKTVRIVRELTNTTRFPNDKEKQTEINLKRLASASREAKLIKAADVLHNSRDIVKSNPSYAPKYLIKKARTLQAIKTNSDIWLKAEVEMGKMIKDIELRYDEEQRIDREKFAAALEAVDAEHYLAVEQSLRDEALF